MGPTKKNYYHYQINMKKKKIKLFYISYSEREYTPLHSAVQLLYYPHPPKNNNKKRSPIKLEAEQMYLTLRSLKKLLLSPLIKKSPLPYPLFLTTNIHFCQYLYKNL